jgi:hypothetical protein
VSGAAPFGRLRLAPRLARWCAIAAGLYVSGLTTAVAVAWICAAWLPLGAPSFPAGPVTYWTGSAPSSVDQPIEIASNWGSAFEIRGLVIPARGASSQGLGVPTVLRASAGWPLPFFRADVDLNRMPIPKAPRDAFWRPHQFLPNLVDVDRSCHTAVGPLLADGGIWGLAWAIALAAARAARSFRREARGRCRRCDYSLEGLQPDASCPECGRPSRARSPAALRRRRAVLIGARWAGVLILVLAAGTVLTFAEAWAASLWSPIGSVSHGSFMIRTAKPQEVEIVYDHPEIERWATALGRAALQSSTLNRSRAGEGEIYFASRERGIGLDRWEWSTTSTGPSRVIRAGWPMPALECAAIDTTPLNFATSTLSLPPPWADAWAPPDWLQPAAAAAADAPRLLPTRILPFETAADVGVNVALFVLLCLLLKECARPIRKRRVRCRPRPTTPHIQAHRV